MLVAAYFERFLSYFVPVLVPLQHFLHPLVQKFLIDRCDFLAALRHRRIVVIVKNELSALPEDDFFSHYFLAVVAEVFECSFVAAARLSWDRLRFWISKAVIFEFNLHIKSIDGEFRKVLMSVFWTNLPTIHFNHIAVTDERRVEGHPEYFRVASHFLIFKNYHNVAVEQYVLLQDRQVYFDIFVAIVHFHLIRLFQVSVVVQSNVLKSVHPVNLHEWFYPLSGDGFYLNFLNLLDLWRFDQSPLEISLKVMDESDLTRLANAFVVGETARSE